jgi:predicted lipoprotein with Yx(FWY)xxD motif
MMRTIPAVLALTALLLVTACSSRQKTASQPAEPAHKVVNTAIGTVLASHRGMTLYTYANDNAPGVSACDDRCALNWPPLVALDDALPVGNWTLVQRSDGLKQWAYNGKPLYGWKGDKGQGDTLGDGQGNGAWKAARP